MGRPKKRVGYDSSVGAVEVLDNGVGVVEPRRLLLKGHFKNADGSLDHFRDIRWIYENMDLMGVVEGDAPSIGAYTWLMEIREDNDARKKFRDYYMKIAPSSKEQEERERMQDEGKGILELIEQVELSLGVKKKGASEG